MLLLFGVSNGVNEELGSELPLRFLAQSGQFILVQLGSPALILLLSFGSVTAVLFEELGLKNQKLK